MRVTFAIPQSHAYTSTQKDVCANRQLQEDYKILKTRILRCCHVVVVLVILVYIVVDFIILILLSSFSITKLSIFPLDVYLVIPLSLILTVWELVSEGSLTGSYPVSSSNVIMYLTTK